MPGLLHIEMNAEKEFMALNWDIFMINFTSENALNYAKKGSDHHKLWQFMDIAYLSVSQELLLLYVGSAKLQGQTASVTGFWKIVGTIKNPSYSFSLEMVCTRSCFSAVAQG